MEIDIVGVSVGGTVCWDVPFVLSSFNFSFHYVVVSLPTCVMRRVCCGVVWVCTL